MTDPTVTPPDAPKAWWQYFIPQTRDVIVAIVFLLSWRILEMVDGEPKLLENTSFMVLATLIVGNGGLGAVISFFYGSTQGSEKKSDTISNLTKNGTGNGGPPDPQPGSAVEPAT